MPTFLLKQIGIMEMRRLLIGTALTLTISLSVAQEISIEENKYVRIGDIEQWITIKGKTGPILCSCFYTVGRAAPPAPSPTPSLETGKRTLS